MNGSNNSATKSARATVPAALVSYHYWDKFKGHECSPGLRGWALDSGAFSAYTQGVAISLASYIDFCKRLRDTLCPPREIFALDVIGDWRASEANCKQMWRAGIEAIPCYHAGEPDDVLVGLARDYPKIAIGGIALARGRLKNRFAEQCFARVWPKQIHGFGYSGERVLLALPFHSVDATTWLSAMRWGRWLTFRRQLQGLNTTQSYRAEIETYLSVERAARAQWRTTYAAQGWDEGLTLYLGFNAVIFDLDDAPARLQREGV